MMGEGYFVELENGYIYFLVIGVISFVFLIKYVIGIMILNGLEILFYMGINIVDLGGMLFDVKVIEG